MSYLVDSDWVIDFLKGQPEAVRLFGELIPEGIAISILTFGEVLEGILFSRSSRDDEGAFENFLEGANVVSLTTGIMRRFAEVRGELRRTGKLIADIDLLIAATAISHDLTLVTRNARHFERVPGIELYQRS